MTSDSFSDLLICHAKTDQETSSANIIIVTRSLEFFLIHYATCFSSTTEDRFSWAFVLPLLNCLTHFRSIPSVNTLSL